MPKASSPIRLERSLMEKAEIAASTFHRSTAEQIEYWADLGRKVARSVDPEKLLEVDAGLAEIRIEPTREVDADPDAVFAELERRRASGALAEAIAGSHIRYQASLSSPGKLEQVHPDGRILIGRFVNGTFREDPKA